MLERLVKWNGETHADITPGEYTQLTGRAGRRGIDVEGHAVVLWQDGRGWGRSAAPRRAGVDAYLSVAVELPALVQHGGQSHRPGRAGTARGSCSSRRFAQFQADRAVVGLARQIRRNEEALDGYREAMTCHLGDFAEYARLRRSLTDREAELARRGAATRRAAAAE